MAPPADSVFEGAAITALGLAAARSVETGTNDRLIEDPLARRLFEAAGVELPMRLDWPAEGTAPTPQEALHLHGSRYIGLRTRFYDDHLVQAAEAGIRQVVLLGAGLDTRAHRLALPADLKLFELDRAELLHWKRAQLRRLRAVPRCSVRDVGVDLREDWPAALQAAGHDGDRPTLFLAEGLLAYLDAEAQWRLAGRVAALAAPGSRMACDRIAGDPRAEGRLEHLSRRSGIDMSALVATDGSRELEQLLIARGWRVTDLCVPELARRHGRDLRDPFASPREAVEPPWLNTRFVVASLPG
ncbi:MAG TPA: SAM-dependent methyltransferase [Solirubrobacteraceae bacterium]|nr:SAM-dependent methyltransferase [Solirubrobacteraceae bacterium]